MTQSTRELVSLTQEQMIERGGYGFLTRGYECEIPISKVVPGSTEPICEGWGAYSHAPDDQPVEAKYDREEDVYLLFSGIARVNHARSPGRTLPPRFRRAGRRRHRQFRATEVGIQDGKVKE